MNIALSNEIWDMVKYCEPVDLEFKDSRYKWLNKLYKKKKRNALIYE